MKLCNSSIVFHRDKLQPFRFAGAASAVAWCRPEQVDRSPVCTGSSVLPWLSSPVVALVFPWPVAGALPGRHDVFALAFDEVLADMLITSEGRLARFPLLLLSVCASTAGKCALLEVQLQQLYAFRAEWSVGLTGLCVAPSFSLKCPCRTAAPLTCTPLQMCPRPEMCVGPCSKQWCISC